MAALRARAAVAAIEVEPASPFAAANARARAWAGSPTAPSGLLAAWLARQPGSVIGDTRYRWDISDRHCRIPDFIGPPDSWCAFRPAECEDLKRDPFGFEERLSLPILIAESCEFLEELAGCSDPMLCAQAQTLLDEADPVFRRDLARYVLAAHPWTDTFALFCLSRTPRALERLRPIATALATSYALLASRAAGIVLGARYPFHDKPLVSASAQLAAGLFALGLQVSLVASVVEMLRLAQRPDGGFGDAEGPADVATTFVAADLLLHVDPSFDPTSAARFVLGCQRPNGLFRALGPEAAWLTVGIARWFEDAGDPFADRFRWPCLPASNRDRKTGLPFYAYFDDIARLFAELSGIAETYLQMAFIDLIGFRAFNNRCGQDAGDAVLAAFSDELRSLRRCAPVRDGGDEFVLIGAPGNTALLDDLEAFRRTWPDRFRERFGSEVPVVAPRIIVEHARGRELRRVREALGRAVGTLKTQESSPGPLGVLRGPAASSIG